MRSYSLKDCSNNQIDYRLDKLFNKENGFYIELGANDGLKQSNTAFFEFFKNWTGVLIEPCTSAFEKCKLNRPKSSCYNNACVSNEYTDDFVRGDFDTEHLMSSVNALRKSGGRRDINTLPKVSATTLEKILNQEKIIEKNIKIDLLSLDTEGYELNILKGLNLNVYRPKYMLIEVYTFDFDNIVQFLKENNYSLLCNFTNYSKKTNPCWDETHNDYLFIDNN